AGKPPGEHPKQLLVANQTADLVAPQPLCREATAMVCNGSSLRGIHNRLYSRLPAKRQAVALPCPPGHLERTYHELISGRPPSPLAAGPLPDIIADLPLRRC